MPGRVKGFDMHDGRSAVQIVADRDHRWPAEFAAGAPTTDPPFDGPLYIPPHLLSDPADTLRIRRAYVRTLLRLEAVLMPGGELNHLRRTFTRAGGDCVCPTCGLKFYDHPHDVADEPDVSFGPGLVILCDRTRVHL